MGIIINRRGRCIRRSVPVSLKRYLDLNDPQKPSPCPVAVFAFQSLDSYRDRMSQNMNRKHEKHTVPPPFEEVTNRLTMYAASLRCSIHRRRFFVKWRRADVGIAPMRRRIPTPVTRSLARNDSAAALTGRRTPRAFVPLRSTAGRRPLRSRNGGAAKRADRCPPFTFLLYMTALSATMRCKNTAPACQAPHGHR